jgi:aminopeptidase N
VDADKTMVWSKTDNHTDSAFMFQYFHAPLMLDRLEAVEHFKDVKSAVSQQVMSTALHDKFWRIRKECIIGIDSNINANIKTDLIGLAKTDPSSDVRAAALKRLADLNDKSLLNLCMNAMKDSSYLVLGTALDAISTLSPETAFAMAQQLKNESEVKIILALAPIFADKGDEEYNLWFLTQLKTLEGYSKFTIYTQYGKFLGRMDDITQDKGLDFLYTAAAKENPWWLRFAAMNGIGTVRKALQDERDLLSKNSNSDSVKIANIEARINTINSMMYEIQSKETDKTLKGYYSR